MTVSVSCLRRHKRWSLRFYIASSLLVAGLMVAWAPSNAGAQYTIACSTTSWQIGTGASEYMSGDAGGIWTEDVLFGLAGHDRIDAFFAKDCAFGYAGEDVIYGGKGTDLVFGAEDSDHVYGGDDHDELFGDGGNDFLYGGADTDLLDGGDGWDVCYLQGATVDQTTQCESLPQAVIQNGNASASNPPALPCQSQSQLIPGAGNGADVLFGDATGPTADKFEGYAGADTARGYEFSDCMFGGPGPDWMDGGGYRDYMVGDTGSDNLYGGGDADQIYGEGSDTSADELDSVDLIDGGPGNDHLVGGRGTDEIYGGDGDNDFCRGGPDSGNKDKFRGCERIKQD